MNIASLQLPPRAKVLLGRQSSVVTRPPKRRQCVRTAASFRRTARLLTLPPITPSTPRSLRPLYLRLPQRRPSPSPSPRPLRKSPYLLRTLSQPHPSRSMCSKTRTSTSRTAAPQLPRWNSRYPRSASSRSDLSQRSQPTQMARRRSRKHKAKLQADNNGWTVVPATEQEKDTKQSVPARSSASPSSILDNKQACLLACLLRLVACLFKQAKRLSINLQASKQTPLCLLGCLNRAWL